jgi:putative tricarboxylic transport membrane protein
VVDLILLYAMSAMGFVMRRYDFPTAGHHRHDPGSAGGAGIPPRQTISQGGLMIFLQKPLSLTLLILAVLAVVGPQLWRAVRGAR